MFSIFQLVGILGLLLITYGVLTKKRKIQDFRYVIGGLCLIIYSIYIGDHIFLALQFIFIIAAVWDYQQTKKK